MHCFYRTSKGSLLGMIAGVKTSFRQQVEGAEWTGSPPSKNPICRKLPLFDLRTLYKSPTSQGLSLFDLTQGLFSEKSPLRKAFVENIINCDCFTSKLLEAAKPIGTNKMLAWGAGGGDRD